MNIVTDNLDQIINAPDGIKRLRELILQLAVQGKLVPQRPEEGSADELLKQIKEAKRKDAEQRKARGERIRKTKPLPTIGKDEIPFEIPEDWCWVRLGEYGVWGAGSTPNRKHPEYYNGGFSWFKSGELNDKQDLKGSAETVTEKALSECSLRQNKIGDVLIAMYGATIGKLAILGEEGTTNQAVCACTCNEGISNVFLFNLLKAWRSRFTEQGAGGAQPNISRIKIVNTVVPLPPLAEQKRIVAKVDELMAWCDELEALKEKRTALRTAALKASLNQLTTRFAGDTETPSSNRSVPPCLCGEKIFPPAASAEPAPPCGALGEHALPLKPSAPPCLCGEKIMPLITSPADVKQLRDAILQLAVQGRLVEQRDADGSAADLLQQIEAAKAADLERRKANGERIRKTKPLPPITSEEIPFEIPANWKWVRLAGIGPIVGGGTPRANNPEFFAEDGIAWITPADMRNVPGKYVSKGRRDISEAGLQKSSAQLMPAGSVLFSSRAPIGYVAIASNPISTNQGFKSCVPAILELNEYLYYFLKYIGEEINANASGTTFKEVSGSEVAMIKLPLPPLAEQQRIVAKVDELMGWCDELERLLQTESETAARFAAAVAKA